VTGQQIVSILGRIRVFGKCAGAGLLALLTTGLVFAGNRH